MRSRSRPVTAASTASTVARISSRSPPATAASSASRLHVERGRVDAEHLGLATAPLDRGAHGQDPVGDARPADRVGGRAPRASRSASAAASVHASVSVNADGAPSGSGSRPHMSWASVAQLVGARPARCPTPSTSSCVPGVDRLAQRHRERDVGGVRVGIGRQLGGGVELVERVARSVVDPAAERLEEREDLGTGRGRRSGSRADGRRARCRGGLRVGGHGRRHGVRP